MSSIVNTGARTVPEARKSNENVPHGFSNGVMCKVFNFFFSFCLRGGQIAETAPSQCDDTEFRLFDTPSRR